MVKAAAARVGVSEDERVLRTHVDINRVVTGTLDSICQEALGSDRHADEPPIVTLEAFAAGVILQRRGRLGTVYRANEAVLGSFLAPFTMNGDPPVTVGEAAAAARFLEPRRGAAGSTSQSPRPALLGRDD